VLRGIFVQSWFTDDRREEDNSGQYNYSWGVAATGTEVYHCDNNNHRVQVYDMQGRHLRSWGSFGDSGGQFQSLCGVAVSPVSGDVFVCDFSSHRIQVFRPDGSFLRMWGGYGHLDGKFHSPYSVFITETGEVYVCDGDNHRLQVCMFFFLLLSLPSFLFFPEHPSSKSSEQCKTYFKFHS
jgi:DNA-binding beta-propeller fold protein YncE